MKCRYARKEGDARVCRNASSGFYAEKVPGKTKYPPCKDCGAFRPEKRER